jgi:hypothetical protein
VPSDTTQEDFAEALKVMPWLAVPFAHAQRREALMKLFGVSDAEGSATLVLLDADHRTITKKGAPLIALAFEWEQVRAERPSRKTSSGGVSRYLAVSHDENVIVVVRGGAGRPRERGG